MVILDRRYITKKKYIFLILYVINYSRISCGITKRKLINEKIINGKNFADVSKNSAKYKSKNNFVKSSKYETLKLITRLENLKTSEIFWLKCQNFLQHCSWLKLLHNYFDDPWKLFSDLYLAKFLDIFNKIVLFV